jgi:ABC-2 type transport system permease protein
MLLRNVLLKTLRDLRWPTLWTGLGMAALGFYFMWLYPAIGKMFDLQSMLDKFPPALKALVGGSLIDVSTPTGFLNMELFPLMLPLILGGFAVAVASGATAGEEARGTMDVLLSEPVQRWRVVTDKAVALSIATIVVAAALFVGLVAGAAVAGTSLALDKVVAGLVSGTLLGLAWAGIALALAAFSGNRALAVGLTAALLVVTYFVNAMAPLVDVLDRIKVISPFYYYIGGDPIRNGLNVGHAAVLAAIAVAGFVVALVSFERRDLAA